MRNISKFGRIAITCTVLVALLLPVAPAYAQLDSNTAQTSLSYSVSESISLSVNVPSLVLTTSPQPIVATLNYALSSSRTALGVLPYFATANALTDGSGNNLPAANILVTTPGQGEFPCNQTQGGQSAALFAGLGNAGTDCVPYVLGTTWGTGAFAGGVGNSQTTFQVRVDPAWAPTSVGTTFNGTLFFVAAAE